MMPRRQVALTAYGGQWGANYREWSWPCFWAPWRALIVSRINELGPSPKAHPWGTKEQALAAADNALNNGVIDIGGAYLMPIAELHDSDT